MTAEGRCRHASFIHILCLSCISRAPVTFGLGCLDLFGNTGESGTDDDLEGDCGKIKCQVVSSQKEVPKLHHSKPQNVNSRRFKHELCTIPEATTQYTLSYSGLMRNWSMVLLGRSVNLGLVQVCSLRKYGRLRSGQSRRKSRSTSGRRQGAFGSSGNAVCTIMSKINSSNSVPIATM